MVNRFPRRKAPTTLIKKALIHGYHFVFELVYFRFQASELIQMFRQNSYSCTSLVLGIYEVVKYFPRAAGLSPFLKSSFCCSVPTVMLVLYCQLLSVMNWFLK